MWGHANKRIKNHNPINTILIEKSEKYICVGGCILTDIMDFNCIINNVISEVKERPNIKISFYDWFGLTSDPFSLSELYFDDIDKLFVNRDSELEILLKAILSIYSHKGGLIAITGPHGVGKSSLLNAIMFSIEKNKKNIRKELKTDINGTVKYFNELMAIRHQFDEDEERNEELEFNYFINEIPEDLNFCIFDRCDEFYMGLPDHISNLKSINPDLMIIISISTINWEKMQKESQDFTSTFDSVISLSPMNKRNIWELIDRRIEKRSIFDDRSMEIIVDYCQGMPNYAIQLAKCCLEIARQQGNKNVTPLIVEEAGALNLNLIEAYKRIELLTETELRIAIHLMENNNGFTADDIRHQFNTTRPTAVYHLREMLGKNIVYTQRHGRFTHYVLKDDMFSALEMKRIKKEV